MEILKKLARIQKELNVPKGRTSETGKYQYRSCDDVLTAVKPYLEQENCVLLMSDSVEAHGDRFYIKATATLVDIESGERESASALAREPLSAEAMNVAQITGASSSYARKYALGGLFAIDNNKDPDEAHCLDLSAPSEPEPEVIEPIKVSTLEEALEVVVSKGYCRGKTIREVFENQKPNALEWISANDPLACVAAKMVLESKTTK